MINEGRINELLVKPTEFVYSGYYSYGGTLYSRPVGHYWSASVGSATYSRNLNFSTGGTARSLNPQGSNGKGYGFAVRCVARNIVANTEGGVNRILSIPLSFPRSGYFSDGGLYVRSSSGDGNYWSSRPSSGTGSYYLSFGSTASISRDGNTRRGGRSVRCVVGRRMKKE